MSKLKPWPVPSDWEKPITEWEKTLIARSLSPESLRTRMQHIKTASRRIGCAPKDVTEEVLLDYVSKQKWQSETRRSYYSTLKSFFDWYSRVHNCDNPAAHLPAVKHAPAVPRPIPEKILAEAIERCRPHERIALELAALAGLRAGEVARVNISDLTKDLCGDALIVHGKGNKRRVVPITTALANKILNQADPDTGWLFPGQDNGHVKPHWISKLGGRVLPSSWTLHTLRHRFGTRAYAGDRDLLAVQRLLGHASVATTQRYVEPPSDAMRRALDAAQAIA